MTQFYSDPARENDQHALPDVEVFYFDGKRYCEGDVWTDSDGETLPAGWYYWYCFPGCLPDGDPMGPYETEQEAINAAQTED